jgi:hypothetical protein
MNSSLVLESARGLAEEAQSAAAEDRARIRSLYLRCFARPAADVEIDRAVEFLANHLPGTPGRDQESAAETSAVRRDAWLSFCHVLLASNEFIYIR